MSRPDPESESCEFCAIARGENRSVEVVCEAENWIAFFPLDPATPGHTLVIPRKHIADLWEAEPALAAQLMTAVIRVGRAINASLRPDGMNLITSAGSVAEQTVFHLHLHVVPRWRRDGFGDIWPPTKKYTDSQLGNVADRIRVACANGIGY
jgi:histidine triad (HIT) family protein